MENKIIINGVTYIKEQSENEYSYVIARTYSAGVFAGYLVKRDGKEVELKEARRIWQWFGAASLSQLAESGTSKPNECKFPEPVSKVILTEVIEILSVTETAKKIIESVPVWKQ
jgi:hypothetical protein